MNDVEEMARALDEHPDYRVLRRLVPTDRIAEPSAEHQLRHAAVVDVETTGIDRETDRIIELGIVRFTYDQLTGQPVEVVGTASYFEDPGRPVPPEIVSLTGITDDMVRGQRIPEDAVHQLLEGVGLVIAHNASFDRPFVERRLPLFEQLHWGCTQRDIDWRALGIGSHSLEFLVYKHLRAFFDGHRAVDDCRATLAVVATPTANGTVPFAKLRESCLVPRVRVCAVGSPIETKDLLKARGYRWNGMDRQPVKTWCREILKQELEAEQEWLRHAVYATVPARAPLVDAVDLKHRWSQRA
jgi:DNA polymerase-3 subunit epsilon